MNHTIEIFEHAEFGKVRTVAESLNLTWFCAICVISDYKNSGKVVADHVDEEDMTNGNDKRSRL